MEIQRQSDYYSLDRPEIRPAQLTAQQITDFTKGVGIPQGLLNTRTAEQRPGLDLGHPYGEDEVLDDLVYRRGPHDPPPYPELIPNAVPGEEGDYELLRNGAHDPHTPAPWLLPDYEDEEDEDLEEVPLEVPLPTGHGLDLDGVLSQAVSRQI